MFSGSPRALPPQLWLVFYCSRQRPLVCFLSNLLLPWLVSFVAVARVPTSHPSRSIASGPGFSLYSFRLRQAAVGG